MIQLAIAHHFNSFLLEQPIYKHLSSLTLKLLQYHISKVSQSEPQMLSSSAAMDDLESALQSLEVKMEGESSSASEMLVRHIGCISLLLSVSYCQDYGEGTSP